MAEVGLVRFSQVALDVAQTTVPRYRTTFSKFLLTQPQLLAILCLMRYEDDAEFDSELNPTHIRQQLGARSVIPAKRGKRSWRIPGVRAAMRTHFPRRLYRRRALVETVFSTAKRKLSARAPGRCLLTHVAKPCCSASLTISIACSTSLSAAGCQQSQTKSKLFVPVGPVVCCWGPGGADND